MRYWWTFTVWFDAVTVWAALEPRRGWERGARGRRREEAGEERGEGRRDREWGEGGREGKGGRVDGREKGGGRGGGYMVEVTVRTRNTQHCKIKKNPILTTRHVADICGVV